MLRASLLLTLTLLLAACQTGGSGTGGSGTGAAAANPVSGAAIETTTLDAPVVGLAEEQAIENPEPPSAAEPDSETATGPVTPEPLSDLDAPPDEDAPPENPAPEDPAPEVPEVIDPALLTPEALACQRRGGQWARIGEGNARSCLRRTRDAGKRCDADRDCQGVCLARSGTCAPVDPLFGCNEVLQDDGRRMNLCLN
jgi:hypothetical protein